jgi:hypothetical protein
MLAAVVRSQVQRSYGFHSSYGLLMPFLLWSATRRLRIAVLVSLGAYAARVLQKEPRLESFPAAFAVLALALFGVALAQLGRAAKVVGGAPPSLALPRDGHGHVRHVYRTGARPWTHMPESPTQTDAAIRDVAIAFLLLAFAGALALVAAVAS